MKDFALHIEYRAIRYEDHRMLPPSAQTATDALYAILRHAGAVGALMELVDENKINDTNGDSLQLMMTNAGELIHLLTEAGMSILHDADNGFYPATQPTTEEVYADTASQHQAS